MDPSQFTNTEQLIGIGLGTALGALTYCFFDTIYHSKKAKLIQTQHIKVVNNSAKPSELELRVENIPGEGLRTIIKHTPSNTSYMIYNRESSDPKAGVGFEEYKIIAKRIPNPQ